MSHSSVLVWRRKTDVGILVGLIVAIGMGLGFTVLSATASAAENREAFSVLSSEATTLDSAHRTKAEFHGIDASTIRLIGTSAGDEYWAGVSRDGAVCLIAIEVKRPENSVASCNHPAQAAEEGVGLRVGGRWEAEAYLVPDVAVASLGSSWDRIGPNLVTPGSEYREVESLSRSADKFTLIRLGEPFGTDD